ncbi:MAG: FtsW/RodA/SpoVE family cell cycle protein [Firmicutes bacterium]|nr:FtsW/RodA/SpoVE family cell cycle protein [Bacillota bacterium]
MTSLLRQILSQIRDGAVYAFYWLRDNPATASHIYSAVIRWVMPLLALSILLGLLRSMMRARHSVEVWGQLAVDEHSSFPVRHWECIVGRAKHCDVTINLPTVSRIQCSLTRRDDGSWRAHELSPRGNTCVNGQPIPAEGAVLGDGDKLSFADVKLTFHPASFITQARERRENDAWRIKSFGRPLFLLTLFQLLTAVELMLNEPGSARSIALCYAVLALTMWAYVIVNRAMGRRGFEAELLAFFSCTVSLAVVAGSQSGALIKQTIAIVLGVVLFFCLGLYLRDLNRTVRTRYFMAAAAVGLLCLSLVFGAVTNGAQNWISIGSVSLQPSELAKICFIFAGAATLERLYVRHNLLGCIILTFTCLGLLALMSDFGAAAIFFVVFLVIAYLRSGDFATLGLISLGCVAALALVLRLKPYVAARFATWGHAWQYVSTSGYQQVRAMSAAASGGLVGVGAGNGWLRYVAAGDTDLVFALVCEEWGLIIALLLVASIICLSVFAVRVTRSGRSSYYTIAACAAASLFVFQTSLNVLGSVDILPLTGVTFPFLSNGGTSMLASWGILAFIKAGDTRQNASFAVRDQAAKLTSGPASPFPDAEVFKPAPDDPGPDSYLNRKGG